MPNFLGLKENAEWNGKEVILKVRGKFFSYHFCTAKLKNSTGEDMIVSKILLYVWKTV